MERDRCRESHIDEVRLVPLALPTSDKYVNMAFIEFVSTNLPEDWSRIRVDASPNVEGSHAPCCVQAPISSCKPFLQS